MHKGLIFAVQIAHEMLSALGQLEQRLCADDLTGRCRLRGVVPGKQGQILQVITDFIGFGAHDFLQPVISAALCKNVASDIYYSFHVL